MFIESTCDDQRIIEENVRAVKISSPDVRSRSLFISVWLVRLRVFSMQDGNLRTRSKITLNAWMQRSHIMRLWRRPSLITSRYTEHERRPQKETENGLLADDQCWRKDSPQQLSIRVSSKSNCLLLDESSYQVSSNLFCTSMPSWPFVLDYRH